MRFASATSTARNRISSISQQVRPTSSSSMTMKEAFISKGPTVTIKDVPIPKPGPHQVLTKVIYSGSNPKDWKLPEMMSDKPPANQGDDISGIVEAVGDEVYEFKPGDRVAAFHEMLAPHGSYAEYAISWDSTTFHLPNNISFEGGAAVPLAAMTAALGLYARLRLPTPFIPATKSIPLVIYGAGSAVASYAIQFAQRSNIHPLICIAGRAQDHVEKIIDRSKGDTVIDYRTGDEAVVQGIRDALKGEKLEYACDAVCEKGSVQSICKVVDPHSGHITFASGFGKYDDVPPGVEKTIMRVGDVHGLVDDLKDFGYLYFRYISKGLADGWFKPQPHEVVPGGLEGVETGLHNLKEGKASAMKYIFKIADTPGAGA